MKTLLASLLVLVATLGHAQPPTAAVCAALPPVPVNAYLAANFPNFVDPFAPCNPDGSPNPGYVDPADFLHVYLNQTAIVLTETNPGVVYVRSWRNATALVAARNANLAPGERTWVVLTLNPGINPYAVPDQSGPVVPLPAPPPPPRRCSRIEMDRQMADGQALIEKRGEVQCLPGNEQDK